MSEHEQLKEEAIEAVRNVWSDKSVSLDTNLDSITEIRDECEMVIEALRGDIRSAGG